MKTLSKIVLPVLFPFLLLVAWMLVLLSPLFIQLEYRRPGFPPDPFGFTIAERIHFADVSRSFLLSEQPGTYFDQFHLADGSPLYNDREIGHMVDVQRLAMAAIRLWAVCLVLSLAAGVFLFLRDKPGLRAALAWGSGITLIILAAAILLVGLAWNTVFVDFHRIFFSGDSWMFPYSDSLIRLFPVEFWQDAVAVAVGGMTVTALAIWIWASAIFAKLRRR
jgi:integral membrane protein (TIGR01906 family)